MVGVPPPKGANVAGPGFISIHRLPSTSNSAPQPLPALGSHTVASPGSSSLSKTAATPSSFSAPPTNTTPGGPPKPSPSSSQRAKSVLQDAATTKRKLPASFRFDSPDSQPPSAAPPLGATVPTGNPGLIGAPTLSGAQFGFQQQAIANNSAAAVQNNHPAPVVPPVNLGSSFTFSQRSIIPTALPLPPQVTTNPTAVFSAGPSTSQVPVQSGQQVFTNQESNHVPTQAVQQGFVNQESNQVPIQAVQQGFINQESNQVPIQATNQFFINQESNQVPIQAVQQGFINQDPTQVPFVGAQQVFLNQEFPQLPSIGEDDVVGCCQYLASLPIFAEDFVQLGRTLESCIVQGKSARFQSQHLLLIEKILKAYPALEQEIVNLLNNTYINFLPFLSSKTKLLILLNSNAEAANYIEVGLQHLQVSEAASQAPQVTIQVHQPLDVSINLQTPPQYTPQQNIGLQSIHQQNTPLQYLLPQSAFIQNSQLESTQPHQLQNAVSDSEPSLVTDKSPQIAPRAILPAKSPKEFKRYSPLIDTGPFPGRKPLRFIHNPIERDKERVIREKEKAARQQRQNNADAFMRIYKNDLKRKFEEENTPPPQRFLNPPRKPWEPKPSLNSDQSSNIVNDSTRALQESKFSVSYKTLKKTNNSHKTFKRPAREYAYQYGAIAVEHVGIGLNYAWKGTVFAAPHVYTAVKFAAPYALNLAHFYVNGKLDGTRIAVPTMDRNSFKRLCVGGIENVADMSTKTFQAIKNVVYGEDQVTNSQRGEIRAQATYGESDSSEDEQAKFQNHENGKDDDKNQKNGMNDDKDWLKPSDWYEKPEHNAFPSIVKDQAAQKFAQAEAKKRAQEAEKKLKEVKEKDTEEQVRKPLSRLQLQDSAALSPKLGVSRNRLKLRAEEKKEKERKAKEEAAKRKVEEANRLEEERIKASRLGRIEVPKDILLFESLPEDLQHRSVEAINTINANKTVVNAPDGTAITGHSFNKLKPGTWLNDEIVNTAIDNYIKQGLKEAGQERSRTATPVVHAFNSHFYSTMEKAENESRDVHGSVRRWAKKAKIDGERLMDCNLILAPVNLGGAHWTLLAFYPKFKTVEFYDSFHGSSRKQMRIAEKYLEGELGELFKKEEWTFREGKSPNQTNGYDCGVFICTTAKLLVLGYEPEQAYTQSNMGSQRVRIAAEILSGGDLTGSLEPVFAKGWLEKEKN